MKSLPLIALAFAAAVFSQANAAFLPFDDPQQITGDSDVITNGSLVCAYNFGNYTTTPGPATDVTINGVTFVAGNNNSVAEGVTHNFDVALGNSPYGSTVAPFASLSANYQNLLANGVEGGDMSPRALTLQNLVAGYTYEVQLWFNDSSGTAVPLPPTPDHPFPPPLGAQQMDLGNGIIDSIRVTFFNASGQLGQYVTGTFVADGTTQDITFTPYYAPAQINALQLRQIAVPEPASALLGGLSLGLLALRRRRA